MKYRVEAVGDSRWDRGAIRDEDDTSFETRQEALDAMELVKQLYVKFNLKPLEYRIVEITE